MAKQLVHYYDYEFAKWLADQFKDEQAFNQDAFLSYLKNHLANETFLIRQDYYVHAFELAFPVSYQEALETFKKIWKDPLQGELGMFKEGFWLWPIGRYIEKHGVKDIDLTLSFTKEFTKRHTGEFIVRHLLNADSFTTMSTFLIWSKDENVHVRRLASEGMRLNLPWAKKTYAALEHRDIYEKVILNLATDGSKFVQKSVGNNLNDLYKHDPTLAQSIIDKMKKLPTYNQHTQWMIKHAQRNQA